MPGVIIQTEYAGIGLGLIMSLTRECNNSPSMQCVILTHDGITVGPLTLYYHVLHDKFVLVKMCAGGIPKKRDRWQPERRGD